MLPTRPKIFGGYTVVEVLIALAVSAAIFISVMVVFGSRKNQTEFSQIMQDLSSKIQTWADQISSGALPDTGGYECTISGGEAVFTYSSGGDSTACIFLGRALMVNPDQDFISAYMVVGTRNHWTGSIDSGNQATTFEQTNPGPAQLQGRTNLFVDTYKLAAGSKIVSSQVSAASPNPNFHLIGIYIDLAGSGSADGSRSAGLLTKAYRFTGGTEDNIKGCIEGDFDDCNQPQTNFSQWDLCISDSDGVRKSLLSIRSAASGLSTQIYDRDCS